MLSRVFVSSARFRVLQQARHLSQTLVTPLLKSHVKDAKPSVAVAFSFPVRALELAETRRTDVNSKVLSYWKALALAAAGCGALQDTPEPASCTGSSGKGSDENPVEQAKKKIQELSTIAMAQIAAFLPEDSDLQKKVDEFLASGKGGQITWGFCMGVCAGFALKKMSKLGAMAVGSLFILLQCASYSGYVDVDYQKMERDMMNFLDINKDGVFDKKDLDSMYKSIMKVLECSLPAGSGFTAGFVLGFRSG